jgi:putative phage-type endonuclease
MTAVELAKTLDMPREEWLKLRRQGIGGSDAAAIVGLDRWRSAFDVYADKLGLKPEQPDNEAMRQGRDLEDYVAQRFMEATGKKVRRRNAILQHPEHTFMTANIDRWVVGENAGFEAKTTSVLNRCKFSQGEFPPNYYVQCMHYMAVTGAERWYLAVLVLNKAFHVFTIERDEAEIQALIEAEKHFWENHVLKQIPPAPDGSEATTEVIKQLFPEAKERTETTLFGYEHKIKQYLGLDEQVKELTKQRDALKQEIQLALADAEIGRAQGYVVEWKNQVRQTLDTQKLKKEQAEIYQKYLKPAQTVRVFKIKEVS